MKLQNATESKKSKVTGNTIAYVIFALAGIAFFVTKDTSQAVIFFGLALVFDPFDQTVKWNNRPLYQKVWLIIHLVLTFAAFIGMVFFNLPVSNVIK